MVESVPPVQVLPISFNEDIEEGDGGIKFKNKYGGTSLLLPGKRVVIGNHIAVHPSKGQEKITHGVSKIEVGNEVIVQKIKGNDKAGLRPGPSNPFAKCKQVLWGAHDRTQHHDPPDETYQYVAYDIVLDEEIGPYDLFNVRMDFVKMCDGRGIQPWYPCCGVWIGFGPDLDNMYWPGGNPYVTIRGQPMFFIGGNYCAVGTHNDAWTVWCIEDFMGHLYPRGQADWNMKYIHIHISQQSTLFWWNYTRSHMVYFTACKGWVTDKWCSNLYLE